MFTCPETSYPRDYGKMAYAASAKPKMIPALSCLLLPLTDTGRLRAQADFYEVVIVASADKRVVGGDGIAHGRSPCAPAAHFELLGRPLPCRCVSRVSSILRKLKQLLIQ